MGVVGADVCVEGVISIEGLQMEELFWRDPRGSQRFLSGLMRAGFVHGILAVFVMVVTLYQTWASETACDHALRGWLGFQVVLQVLQFPSRWCLYRSLPPCPSQEAESDAQQREIQQQMIDGLVALVQSRKWSLNRLFGLLSLGWFMVGVWWTFRVHSTRCSPMLYYVCISLLSLFCIRTVFVFLWFGFIFGGAQQQSAGYAGPFKMPGASAEMLQRLSVHKFAETDAAGEEMQCSICIEAFEASDEVRKLPCGHYFHRACIDEWLRKSMACPMCNADVAKSLPAANFENKQHYI